MNIQSWIPCLLAGILIQSGLFAQSDDNRKAARAEMHKYVSEQVAPVMKLQRTKLDSYLSPAEQSDLDEIRSALQTLKAEKEASGMQRRGRHHHQKDQAVPSPEQREEFRKIREEMRTHMEGARAILETHHDEIKSLLEEVSTERAQWRTDMRSIKEKYFGEHVKGGKMHRNSGHHRARPDSTQNRADSPHSARHGRRGRHHGPGNFSRPMGFLLWDGELPTPPNQEEELNLSIYPNPTRSESNIRYEVTTAGKVTITLLNDQGTIIKTLTSASKAPGIHEQHVQHDGLKPGVYIYRVETASGTETGKLIIE